MIIDIVRKNLRYIKFFISFFLVVVAFYHLDFNLIQTALLKLTVRGFLISVSIMLLMFIVMFFRWFLIFGNISNYRMLYVFSVYFKSLFINFFTPANIGGDVYRFMTLSTGSVSKHQLIQALVTERFFGFCGFIIIYCFSYLMVFSDLRDHNLLTVGFVFSLSLIFILFTSLILGRKFLLFIRPHINSNFLVSLFKLFDYFLDSVIPKKAMGIIALTFVSVIIWIFSINILAEQIGLQMPLSKVALVATAVEIIRFIPVTVQGVGLREGLFAILLGALGYSYELSYTLGIISYAILGFCILVCGPIGFLAQLLNESSVFDESI